MDRSRTDKRGLDDSCTGATEAPAVIHPAGHPRSDEGRVFGAVSTSFTLGNTVAFLMVAPLMTAIGPRGVYAVGGAASVVAFGVLAFGFAGAKTPWLEDATPPTG